MSELVTKHKDFGRYEGFILAVIFFLAAVVRLIGPVTTIALGQSDAYAHLQYLNDMVNDGHLRHSTYPPGYYWLMSLPVKLFGVNSYWVARFGGVLWGLGQVLAVYLLAKRAFGRHAARWSAFLIAGFPLFHWLQKTGVGVYPSQAGLMILPLLVLSWDKTMREGPRHMAAFFLLLSVLAVTVPMMMVDLTPFLALDLLWRRFAGGLHRHSLAVISSVAVSMVALIAIYWLRSGSDGFFQTASILTNQQIPGEITATRLLALLWMYIRPERLLLPGVWLNIPVFTSGAILVLLLVTFRKEPLFRSVLLWAFIAWTQTVFGVFQFALYMRAGWVFLLASSVLGGWLIIRAFDLLPGPVARFSRGIFIFTCLCSLINPPNPKPHLSSAESDLVMVLHGIREWADGGKEVHPIEQLQFIDPDRPTSVWSRRFNGFYGRQGDPVPAFLERCPKIEIPRIGQEVHFDPARQHIVLLDDRAIAPDQFGVMTLVNPTLIDQFVAGRESFMLESDRLREALILPDTGQWRVASWSLPQGLNVVVLKQGD